MFILYLKWTFITNNTNQAHEVHTLGEFKDDQFQGHEHKYYRPAEGSIIGNVNGTNSGGRTANTLEIQSNNTHGTPRIGTTTHGKQVGITYLIKVLWLSMLHPFVCRE